MADIFEKLNILNTSLQGPNTHILLLSDKICAFIKKLELWKSLRENDNTEMFGSMSGFIQENELSFDDVKPIILTHLDNLGKQFTHYFPDGPLPVLKVGRGQPGLSPGTSLEGPGTSK